jgi:hypothetical protein
MGLMKALGNMPFVSSYSMVLTRLFPVKSLDVVRASSPSPVYSKRVVKRRSASVESGSTVTSVSSLEPGAYAMLCVRVWVWLPRVLVRESRVGRPISHEEPV